MGEFATSLASEARAGTVLDGPSGTLGAAAWCTIRPMRIADFALERYFARWEFAVRYLLCASDVEGWPMAELLALADEETRALWDGLRLGYTESTGHPLLRREIAGLYDTVVGDEVLVFAGAEEAIFCLSNVLLGPGDHAIVTWPGYQSLYEVARATGAEVGLHRLHAADGWALDVERLRRELKPETRLVVVNAPHNPTGMLPSHAEWATLTGLCAEAGIHLLADEVYRYLEVVPDDRLVAGCDALEARRLTRGDVQVVRHGRVADRVAGDARPGAPGPLRGAQGLHDDLLVGALGDPGDRRAPGTRTGAGPVSGDRGGEPRPPRSLLQRLVDDVRMGSPAGWLDRLPAAGCRGPDRRFRGRAGGGRRRVAPAGLGLRTRREPLPDRLRS